MTKEQREAAAARLAKAREKRELNNPESTNKSIHESVRKLSDKHPLSLNKVRKWIRTQKTLRAELNKSVRKNEKGALARFLVVDSYIKNMENYLRTGEWLDLCFGEHQEHRIKFRSIKLAYHSSGPMKGLAKRTMGVFYPDIGDFWSMEMDREYYDRNK